MPKKQTKILVYSLILINMISIGFFALLLYFTENLVQKSISTENIIKTELKVEDMRSFMKDDFTLGKIYQEKLMNYIVPSSGTVDLIKIIEKLVLNNDLKSDIKNVSNKPYDIGSSINVEYVSIDMDVTGEWKNIHFFIKSLENYPLKIDINKLSINKFSDYVANGKKVPIWAGNIEFTVLKIKDNK
jgi:hypothetical protein